MSTKTDSTLLKNPVSLDNNNWKFLLRITLKAAVLFLFFNVLFALATPQETVGRFSLYNAVLPGRLRLPYGENSAESYNLSLNNI
ncbi:MAG: hypothetical protein WAM60_19430, partial [Candidatus Promineifilaceae bacterium]